MAEETEGKELVNNKTSEEVGENETSNEERDERKKKRRDRVLSQLDGGGSMNGSSSGNTDETFAISPGAPSQIESSRAILDRRKVGGISAVTKTRILADANENDRLAREEARRNLRLQHQQSCQGEDSLESEIDERFDRLANHSVPQDLAREIEAERSMFSGIMAKKAGVIDEFKEQLKQADEEYVQSLKHQEAEVDHLRRCIKEQVQELGNAYEAELALIEDAYLADRSNLIERNRREVMDLTKNREDVQLKHMQDQQQQRRKHQDELGAAEADGAGQCKSLKLKLELDTQKLQHQLEETRATYQLKDDQLDYDYRALCDRESEYMSILQNQRKRVLKTKDQLSCAGQSHSQLKSKNERKTSELSKDCVRLRRQYQAMKSKFQHFEQADLKKYKAIRSMHEDDVGILVEKLCSSERWIQQHLHLLQWESSQSSDRRLSSKHSVKAMPTWKYSGRSDVFDQGVIFSDDHAHETWTQLERSMQDYYELLSKRSEGIENVNKLLNENDVLRKQLNHCLFENKINQELIVPPSVEVHVDVDSH